MPEKYPATRFFSLLVELILTAIIGILLLVLGGEILFKIVNAILAHGVKW